MLNVYKLIARDKNTKRQIQKWVYATQKKFDKFSVEIITRYANKDYKGVDRQVEVYRMNNKEKWILQETHNGKRSPSCKKKYLKDIKKNEFCVIKKKNMLVSGSDLVSIRVIDLTPLTSCFSQNGTIKVKPIGSNKFLWLSPLTEVQ